MKAEQLRKSILQLAIQGKLVKQDPNDEPASVLLERIRAEKQRLIKEGKIKKDKGDSIIFKGDDNCHYEKIGTEVRNIEEEIPFEIPDTWCWVRFPQLVCFELGKTPDRHTDKFWNKGVYPWFSIADMQDKKTISASKDKITEVALKEKFNGVLSPKGTLLMSFKLTVGRTSILGVDAVHNEAIISIFPYINENNITRDYLMNILGLLVNYVDQTDAIKGATLNSGKLKSMFIPVPPLAEQERIVSEIKRFEPLLAEYDKLEQHAVKFDNEIYDRLKKSILQYAIQGKLVKQDESDEPASALLERIRVEKKAQLGKKYIESYIYKGDDNCYYEKVGKNEPFLLEDAPFDIPDSWAWARLGDIVNIVSARRVHQSDWKSKGIPFYRAREIVKLSSYGKVDNDLFISEELFNNYKMSGVPMPGDLMVTAVGTIGKTYIVQQHDKFYYKDASVICFENRYGVSSLWLKNLMDSPYMIKTIRDRSAGTTVDTITIEKANNYLIPIPPQAEQERICLKIEEILNRIEKDEI